MKIDKRLPKNIREPELRVPLRGPCIYGGVVPPVSLKELAEYFKSKEFRKKSLKIFVGTAPKRISDSFLESVADLLIDQYVASVEEQKS